MRPLICSSDRAFVISVSINPGATQFTVIPRLATSRASARDIPMGMSAIDWPHAQAALKEALARTDDGPSVPWDNPASGARGTVTPIASAFTKDGLPCRNFIASHVKDGVETWSEGLACRVSANVWEVKSVKQIKKS